MNNKTAGWTLLCAALGMGLVLMSVDVSNLHDFNEVWTPAFIGTMMAHIGNILMAFVGGKLIPTEPQNQRSDDK